MNDSAKKVVTKKVVVASNNPVKLEAVRLGLAAAFPNEQFEVVGCDVPSGVSAQPMSEAETLQGACNRVAAAAQASPDVDFWVGVEGGVAWQGDELEAFAWVVITSRSGKFGKGRTGSFFLPSAIIELVKNGKELGEADDIVFGATNSKQGIGAVGFLTNSAITRTTYYEHAVVMALIPFMKTELY